MRSLIPVILAHAALDAFDLFDFYLVGTWSTGIKDLILGVVLK